MADYDQAHDSGAMTAESPSDISDSFSRLTFKQVFSQTRMAMAVSDPRLPDNPLVFVNEAFCRLTGYSREEAVGNNCRFLQGPDTDPARVREITAALKAETVIVTELKNYRKDGTAFWNALHVGPIYDEHGKLMYFFGSQWDVSDVHSARAEEKTAQTLARELSHRMKNMFSVMNSIVGMTGRSETTAKDTSEKISGRIMALGRAHEATLATASGAEPVDLGPMIETVLAPYAGTGAISIDGPQTRLDSNMVSMMGLTLHELAINALKYGALSDDDGRVILSWRIENLPDDAHRDVAIVLTWKERGGPAVREPSEGGSGTTIVEGLLASAGGGIEYDWNPDGLTVAITMPLPESSSATPGEV